MIHIGNYYTSCGWNYRFHFRLSIYLFGEAFGKILSKHVYSTQNCVLRKLRTSCLDKIASGSGCEWGTGQGVGGV